MNPWPRRKFFLITKSPSYREAGNHSSQILRDNSKAKTLMINELYEDSQFEREII